MTKLLNDYSYRQNLPIDLALQLIKDTFSNPVRGIKNLKVTKTGASEGEFSFITDTDIHVDGSVDAENVGASGYVEVDGERVLVWEDVVCPTIAGIEQELTLVDTYASKEEALEYVRNPELARMY